jgi:hypothetical protein
MGQESSKRTRREQFPLQRLETTSLRSPCSRLEHLVGKIPGTDDPLPMALLLAPEQGQKHLLRLLKVLTA